MMKPIALLMTVILLPAASPVNAGTLLNGGWKPNNCGIKPNAPIVDDSSVEAFNKSVTAINNWQQLAKTYFECLIKEANADNSVIADTANREQSDYRQSVEKISNAANEAKKKLEKK